MKKSTLFFFSTLIAVFLSASTSYAYSTSRSACEASCGKPCSSYSARCGYPTVYMCWYNSGSTSNGVFTSPDFPNISECQRSLLYYQLSGHKIIKSCYRNGSYYIYQRSSDPVNPECNLTSCPTNCSSCDSSSVCTTCNSGYYLSSGSCVTCPSNATCNGSSTFTCNSGYTKSGSSCVQDKPKNTVSSCPSRMTLSSDGCCCINK